MRRARENSRPHVNAWNARPAATLHLEPLARLEDGWGHGTKRVDRHEHARLVGPRRRVDRSEVAGDVLGGEGGAVGIEESVMKTRRLRGRRPSRQPDGDDVAVLEDRCPGCPAPSVSSTSTTAPRSKRRVSPPAGISAAPAAIRRVEQARRAASSSGYYRSVEDPTCLRPVSNRRPHRTVGARLRQARSSRFVGRRAELELFERALDEPASASRCCSSTARRAWEVGAAPGVRLAGGGPGPARHGARSASDRTRRRTCSRRAGVEAERGGVLDVDVLLLDTYEVAARWTAGSATP